MLPGGDVNVGAAAGLTVIVLVCVIVLAHAWRNKRHDLLGRFRGVRGSFAEGRNKREKI